jgi:hypothetical protein
MLLHCKHESRYEILISLLSAADFQSLSELDFPSTYTTAFHRPGPVFYAASLKRRLRPAFPKMLPGLWEDIQVHTVHHHVKAQQCHDLFQCNTNILTFGFHRSRD